jgi:hypothetical protein
LEKALPIILKGNVITENNVEIGLKPSSGPQEGGGQG